MPSSNNGNSAAGEDTSAAAPSSRTRQILIVEDNINAASAMAKVVERGGYNGLICHTGTQALALIDSMNGHRASVVAAMIDIHLPDLHGLALSSKLRELLGPQVPIIVISGDTSMENLNSLPLVGATYFFPKPVNAGTLLERLKEWLAPPAAEQIS